MVRQWIFPLAQESSGRRDRPGHALGESFPSIEPFFHQMQEPGNYSPSVQDKTSIPWTFRLAILRKAEFIAAILSMGFKAESARPKGAHSRLWSPRTGRHRRPVRGLNFKM